MIRSQEAIAKADLRRLLRLAREDIDEFFERNPAYIRQFRGKEKLIALCQGAALHYVDGKNGIKDFDVWFFYPQRGAKTLPYRRRGMRDYGVSKFGRDPNLPMYEGRKADVLFRSTEYFNSGSPEAGLVNYLSERKTKTAKQLAEKAVIGLFPERVFGAVLWWKGV